MNTPANQAPAMEPRPAVAGAGKKHLLRALVMRASAPYLRAGRFAMYFARGKLGGDPAFAAILEQGLLGGRERILDIGCGQGLLAAWLLAAGDLAGDGLSRPGKNPAPWPASWPTSWPPAPTPVSLRGIDIDPQEIARARTALQAPARQEAGAAGGAAGAGAGKKNRHLASGAGSGQYRGRHRGENDDAYHSECGAQNNQDDDAGSPRASAAERPPIALRFERADMCRAELGQADAIVMLDVLHYIDNAAQDALLLRVRQALGPSGALLLRVGDAGGGWRFHYSVLVDRLVSLLRLRGGARLHCRSMADWLLALQALGFGVRRIHSGEGRGFANALLLATVGDNTSMGDD